TTGAAATCPRWTCGTSTSPRSARNSSRHGSPWLRNSSPWPRKPTANSPPPKTRSACATAARPLTRSSTPPTVHSLWKSCALHCCAPAPTNCGAVSASSAPTATTCSCGSTTCQPRAMPAKANPGRTPSRCGSPASNCSAPPATPPSSASTAFPRNSTLSGGAASPLTSAPRNKSSSPLPYPTMSPKNSPGHDSGSQEGAWNVNGEHPAPERTDSPQTEENITPPTPLRGVELARQALAKARAEAKARGAAPQGQDRKPQRSLVRSRGEPHQFGDAIRAWLIEHGWQEQVAIGGIFGRWSRIVGERLAEHVRPCSYADGELVVAVDSPAWATQIRAMAPQLVRKLNEELGHGAVRVIKVNGPGGYRTSRGQWRVR